MPYGIDMDFQIDGNNIAILFSVEDKGRWHRFRLLCRVEKTYVEPGDLPPYDGRCYLDAYVILPNPNGNKEIERQNATACRIFHDLPDDIQLMVDDRITDYLVNTFEHESDVGVQTHIAWDSWYGMDHYDPSTKSLYDK